MQYSAIDTFSTKCNSLLKVKIKMFLKKNIKMLIIFKLRPMKKQIFLNTHIHYKTLFLLISNIVFSTMLFNKLLTRRKAN